jgi:glycosyltransferase involved in cell wall biosynthesis
MSVSFSVVLPFFNEAEFLPRTLSCWLSQTRAPEEIILVDNGSTDRSAEIAQAFLGGWQSKIACQYVAESRPGKIHALTAGCERASGSWIVFSDADTLYPSDYLSLCSRIIAGAPSGTVALMALPVSGDPQSARSRIQRKMYVRFSRIFRKHAYTGGYGHVLSRDAFFRCGGYAEKYWPYVLADHEIMYRLLRLGASVYHTNLWCQPSERRPDRRRVRWSLFERGLYLATPHRWQGWFFYRFLGPRFARRSLSILNLREQPWKKRSFQGDSARDIRDG